jgi:predicted dehydrogenase
MLAIQKAVHSGAIGEVHAVYSDHAADEYGKGSMESRLLNPSLAGGPLMDLGPYPMVWVS